MSQYVMKKSMSRSHLVSLCSMMLLYLFFTAHMFPRSAAMQKFYPNGRYGRRSDLPPLVGRFFSAKLDSPSSALTSEPVINNQEWLASGGHANKPFEDVASLWCTLVNEKTFLYRCYDRFSMKLVKNVPQDNRPVDSSSVQGQDQDQA